VRTGPEANRFPSSETTAPSPQRPMRPHAPPHSRRLRRRPLVGGRFFRTGCAGVGPARCSHRGADPRGRSRGLLWPLSRPRKTVRPVGQPGLRDLPPPCGAARPNSFVTLPRRAPAPAQLLHAPTRLRRLRNGQETRMLRRRRRVTAKARPTSPKITP
jgi:hypothetical protein